MQLYRDMEMGGEINGSHGVKFNLLSVSRLVCPATNKSIGMHQSVLSAKPKVAHATLKNLRENQTSDTRGSKQPLRKPHLHTHTTLTETNLHINALTYALMHARFQTHTVTMKPHTHTHTIVLKERTICSLIT